MASFCSMKKMGLLLLPFPWMACSSITDSPLYSKEVLWMAEMENLIVEVRWRRWKFIGHIMRKEPNNDCRTALTCTLDPTMAMLSWADPRQHGQGRRREKEKELDGRTGVMYPSQRPTELVGGRELRPYVPHGMKQIGEGEGDPFVSTYTPG